MYDFSISIKRKEYHILLDKHFDGKKYSEGRKLLLVIVGDLMRLTVWHLRSL